jgi:hypothetical protein
MHNEVGVRQQVSELRHERPQDVELRRLTAMPQRSGGVVGHADAAVDIEKAPNDTRRLLPGRRQPGGAVYHHERERRLKSFN